MARVDDMVEIYRQLEWHAGRANAQLERTRMLADDIASALDVSLWLDVDNADSGIQRLRGHLEQLNEVSQITLTFDEQPLQTGLNRINQTLVSMTKQANKLVAALRQASNLTDSTRVPTPPPGPGGDNGGGPGGDNGPNADPPDEGPPDSPPASEEKASKLTSSFEKVAETAKQIFNIENAVSFLNWANDIGSVNDRLQLVNDGTMTQAQLQQKVMQSANAARQPYQDVAELVVGIGTSGVFKNNNDMIGFASRFEKVLTAGSASPNASSDARNKITESFSAGSLDTDGLDILTQASPVFLKVLADGLDVSRDGLYKLAEQGNLTSTEIVKAFSGQDALIGEAFGSTSGTINDAMTLAKNKAAEWISQLNGADGPLQKVNDSVMRLVQWLDTPQAQGLLTALNAGIILLSDGIAALTGFIVNNMGIVIGVLIGLAAVVAYVAMEWLIGWLIAMMPLILIVAAIAGIIAVLLSLGLSAQQIIGAVAGFFNMLFASIWNGIAYAWNFILAFVEFFGNVFSDPVYAIQKLFYDLMQNFMGSMYNMLRSGEDFAGGFMKVMLEGINGALKGVNKLLEGWNKLTGSNIKPVVPFDETNIHALSDKLKQQMDGMKPPDPTKGKPFDLSKYKMDQKSLSGAYKAGDQGVQDLWSRASDKLSGAKERGFGLPKRTDPLADPLGGAAKTPNIANIGKVGEVSKIGESVEISSEDLKSMRELAEMKNIQNFVSLTPSISFGDTHVKNESDVHSIISKIQEHLETEFASSVEGVHR